MKERWKQHPRWPIEVSSLGRVRRDGRTKNAAPNARGYLMTSVAAKTAKKFVHVLVLETFRGLCPVGKESRHLNGNKTDNRLRNLRWGTRKQQAADRERHGTILRGVNHPCFGRKAPGTGGTRQLAKANGQYKGEAYWQKARELFKTMTAPRVAAMIGGHPRHIRQKLEGEKRV